MGKLFFPKTAAGNLVRNRRFFFPYLLTGLLTVAMSACGTVFLVELAMRLWIA